MKKHRFALVVFNHEVSVASDLVYCNDENKKKIIDVLKNLAPSGSTNISEALLAGINILNCRDDVTKCRISTIMLITDGLSNTGLSREETLVSLQNITLPLGCVFNTFGFGEDHDSKLLHAIALKTHGVYYYVPSIEFVHKIFGGCVSTVLSCRARKVKVTLNAQDGSRIITLTTPFNISEKKVAKDYEVDIGLMYSGEYKSIIFRLSLRKMDKIIKIHELLKVKVEFLDIMSSEVVQELKKVTIERGSTNSNEKRPSVMDENLNRYLAARSILEAIELANRLMFLQAQEKILTCINDIRTSPSGESPYCLNLIEDLDDCLDCMKDLNSFQMGVHSAHAYASMYYMERSSGVELRKQKKTSQLDIDNYGYLTDSQIEVQYQFYEKAPNYLSMYCK